MIILKAFFLLMALGALVAPDASAQEPPSGADGREVNVLNLVCGVDRRSEELVVESADASYLQPSEMPMLEGRPCGAVMAFDSGLTIIEAYQNAYALDLPGPRTLIGLYGEATDGEEGELRIGVGTVICDHKGKGDLVTLSARVDFSPSVAGVDSGPVFGLRSESCAVAQAKTASAVLSAVGDDPTSVKIVTICTAEKCIIVDLDEPLPDDDPVDPGAE